MSQPQGALQPGLPKAIAQFDETFSKDLGAEMGRFFAEDARLMWPEIEDIVGREAITNAFRELTAKFTTFSWSPERAFVHLSHDAAISVGRFIEDRAPRAGGPAVRIFGRLVEYWSCHPDGTWTIQIALTSRYAEDQPLNQPPR
jgi:ketosteroid isomerase-like protein